MSTEATIKIVAGSTDIPIVMDNDGIVAKYLSRRLKSDEWPFSDTPDEEFSASINHGTGIVAEAPVFADLPTVTINSYLHPLGASRFGRGLFLISCEHMPDLLSSAWGQSWDGIGNIPTPGGGQLSPVTLSMEADGTAFTAKLYLQTPIQLDVTTHLSQEPRQLWICPFVDARFAVLHQPLDPLPLNVKSSEGKTWLDVETAISSQITPSVTSAGGAPATAFLYPDPGYFSVARSAGYALDHVAHSSGRRVTFDPDAEVFHVSTADAAITALDSDQAALATEGFPAVLGEVKGNPAQPDAEEFHFTARKLYDYFDNSSWHSETATSGAASGETGSPQIHSTFYLEHFGTSVDSGSQQRWTALTAEIASEYRKWQQRQFCLSFASFPATTGLAINHFCDYTFIKIGCYGESPACVTTQQSSPVGVYPQVNISQSTNLYRHNKEMARMTLQSGGIPLGATSGQATITPNESATNYDGVSQPLTIGLLGPADPAIPSGTVLACYYQSHEGWFAIEGGSGTPVEISSDPWIRFRVLRPVGTNESGQWEAEVTQHLNTDDLPGQTEPSPISCGTVLQINDPNNLFAEVVFADQVQVVNCVDAELSKWKAGSTGTAYYRTPTSACNVPENTYRWEVETCSQTIKEIRGVVLDCVTKNNSPGGGSPGNGTGSIKISDTDFFNTSQYPAVDFPMELTDGPTEENYCWELQFDNPFGLDVVSGSKVRLRRRSEKKTSLPLNAITPHGEGETERAWYLWKIEEDDYFGEGKFARWIKAKKLQSGTGDFQFSVDGAFELEEYWDGQDPRQGETYNSPCRPGIKCVMNCECITEDMKVTAFYDPNTHAYQIVSTEAALLGTPTVIQFVKDWSVTSGCSFAWEDQPIKAFPCEAPPVPQQATLQTIPIDVVTGAYRGDSNDVCFHRSEIQVCAAQVVPPECVNVCFPCNCDDYDCSWVYNEESGLWDPVTECPDNIPDCNCTGERPTNTPAPGEPTTISFPCGPVVVNPCAECIECPDPCPSQSYEITWASLGADLTNGDRVESTTVTYGAVEECCRTATVTFTKNGGDPQQRTVTMCLQTSSVIPACQLQGLGELQLNWDQATVHGMTLPTDLGPRQQNPYCEGSYGYGGCGVLPDFPDAGGGSTWDYIQADAVCCVVESQQIVESAKGVHYIGSGFHTAELGGAMPEAEPESKQSLSLGDAFAKAYPVFFASCNCTAGVKAVMDRWQRSNNEPTMEQATKVASTIYGKLGTTNKSHWPIKTIAALIYDFSRQRKNDNG